ncbi:MAG: hypothetical protein ACE37H_17865 [Phycisphaeraceae bacterium]
MKRHPADFLLWKPDSTHLMKWDSPWGAGYPGWHIECSAMARAVLGVDEIDIHTGGEDNIFPHHECEIAQSCGATGRDQFARFWMHGRHLMVEGEKMSKSKGNFFTVRQILDGKFTGRPVDPAVLRFELIKAHYRSQMNFTRQGIKDSAAAVGKLRRTADQIKVWESRANRQSLLVQPDISNHPVFSEFATCLSDDLNMSGALGAVFKYLKREFSSDDAPVVRSILQAVDRVLGVLQHDIHFRSFSIKQEGGGSAAFSALITSDNQDIEAMAKAIDLARADKDYDRADSIRAELDAMGYQVKTTKDGTVATKKLA